MERDTLPPIVHTHNVSWIEMEPPPPPPLQAEACDPNEDDIDIAMAAPLTSFKSMLLPDSYVNSSINFNPSQQQQTPVPFVPNPATDNFLMHHHHMESFPLDPSSHSHPFSPPKPSFSPFFNLLGNNPFDNSFDFAPEASGFLSQSSNSPVFMGFSGLNALSQMGTLELSSGTEFPATRPPEDAAAIGAGFSPASVEIETFGGSGNALFSNRGKVLRPLEVLPPVGSPPTLFQKRAALRRGSDGAENLGGLGVLGLERKRRKLEEGEIEEGSIEIDGLGLSYDSDEVNENDNVVENVNNGGGSFDPSGTVNGGDQKGKKKGLPAKNLMAERRRRKKLNDRLYMLRSVVPKISKMDRASILGDAIDYLKELLQRINDLHNELESTPAGSLLPPSTSFHPLTPTPPTLPCRVKEELYPGALPSPKNQPAKVEVRVREGRAVNIHMFCTRRPGLLLSTMRALDNLGLDVQQAVISCFNGFALDVFRAEQCREGQDVLPEQIKAVLLDSAAFHGMM